MPKRHDIRRLAMQVLYQLDVRGQADAEAIRQGLESGPDAAKVQEEAFALATHAWEARTEADKLIQELAPQWPTHRQPPVDRAILRLAYFEMVAGLTPPKVAINEAVELAKEYSSEHSSAFVNGVLDKVAKRLPPQPEHPQPPTPLDPWLADALKHPKPPTTA